MIGRTFQIPGTESQYTKTLFVERIPSGEDGEEDEYEIRIGNLDCDCFGVEFSFDSEAQAKEFLTKFAALVEGFDVEPVTKRIQRLEAEREGLRQACLEEAENMRQSVSQTEIDAIERRLRKAAEPMEPAKAIVKTLTNQHGQAFAVDLSDGTKISIQRDGGATWLRIEPTPIVRETGEEGKSE